MQGVGRLVEREQSGLPREIENNDWTRSGMVESVLSFAYYRSISYLLHVPFKLSLPFSSSRRIPFSWWQIYMIVVARPGMGCYAALLRRDGRLFGFWIHHARFLLIRPGFHSPRNSQIWDLVFPYCPWGLG